MNPGQLFRDERAQLADTLQQLGASGLSPGRSGNASIRVDGGLLISATGLAAADCRPDSLVFIADDGSIPDGQLRPSSEWHLHYGVYRSRPDAGAIVHCHSRYATALACKRLAIPAYHYMVAVAGGDDIRCADYATFGTLALSDATEAAMFERRACLLANHGQVALGETPQRALQLAQDVEELAAGYYHCLAIGGPVLLSAEEMAEVSEQFKGYGQQHDQQA